MESLEEIESQIALLDAEIARKRSGMKLFEWRPYEKQRSFYAAGADYRERLLLAGNQLGKTMGAAAEVAYHATGLYPDWWVGRRFNKNTKGWVAGVTSLAVRDTCQKLLLGDIGSHGTGMIPRENIIKVINSRGVPNAVDTIIVKHCLGGESLITFKSYDQGREKWQGETLDYVWCDEEPPEETYTEGLTRTNASKDEHGVVVPGIMMMTFTPLNGMSMVVSRFLRQKPAGTHVTSMTIDDVDHYSAEVKASIIASYPEHEREARAKGIPLMGSGRVFPIPEEFIKCSAFPVPLHWPQICGLDFGWDHPSAGVRLAWDRDNDIIYVCGTHRIKNATPLVFAGGVRAWGGWVPWAWPHDGLQHDKGSGKALSEQYKEAGLKMLFERATFEDGKSGVEAGITEMLQRMETGRLKVFDHLSDWFDEFRMYHRKNGLIVKMDDDLMAATRYAIMMRRYAIVRPMTKAAVVPFRQDALGWMA